jgi:hypothetical protein
MLSVSMPTELAKMDTMEPTKNTEATSKPETARPIADTAQISGAAQAAAKAALQEATETPAQTAKEATGGDRQAQRLVARYAASALAR